MGEERPTHQLVLQRIRNRIIEYLKAASEPETYEMAFGGGGEAFEQWDDWYSADHHYPPPVFSDEERRALSMVHYAIELASERTSFSPSLEELRKSSEWQEVVSTARASLEVFMKRGTLSEEQEVPS